MSAVNTISTIQPPATQTQTQSESALAQLTSTTDTFLQMLTVQLQNQDPLDPQDPTEFTEQLVSISQVEQQIQTNRNLEQLVSMFQLTEQGQALGYVGFTVESVGNQTTLENIDAVNRQAEIAFELGANASSTLISIVDSSNRVVQTLSGPTSQGLHRIVWDGSTSAGTAAPNGTYTFRVQSEDAARRVVPVTTRTTGLVSGIEVENDNIYLTIGRGRVTLADLLTVRL